MMKGRRKGKIKRFRNGGFFYSLWRSPLFPPGPTQKKFFLVVFFFWKFRVRPLEGMDRKPARTDGAKPPKYTFTSRGRRKKWHKGATAIGLAATLRGRRCHLAVRVPRQRQRGKKKKKKKHLMPCHPVLSGHVYLPSVSKTLQRACTCCQLNLSYSNCTSTHRWGHLCCHWSNSLQ